MDFLCIFDLPFLFWTLWILYIFPFRVLHSKDNCWSFRNLHQLRDTEDICDICLWIFPLTVEISPYSKRTVSHHIRLYIRHISQAECCSREEAGHCPYSLFSFWKMLLRYPSLNSCFCVHRLFWCIPHISLAFRYTLSVFCNIFVLLFFGVLGLWQAFRD